MASKSASTLSSSSCYTADSSVDSLLYYFAVIQSIRNLLSDLILNGTFASSCNSVRNQTSNSVIQISQLFNQTVLTVYSIRKEAKSAFNLAYSVYRISQEVRPKHQYVHCPASASSYSSFAAATAVISTLT